MLELREYLATVVTQRCYTRVTQLRYGAVLSGSLEDPPQPQPRRIRKSHTAEGAQNRFSGFTT